MASISSKGAALAVVDRLKLELHERVTETLNSVYGSFKQELELAVQPPAPSTPGQVDYDSYNDCCQRLMHYISANMDTSPYFTQQMDRIILACHSNTPEQVLSSLVTKDMWLRPREKENNREENREEDTRAKKSSESRDNARTEAVEGSLKSADTAVKIELATSPECVEVKRGAPRRRRSVSSMRQTAVSAGDTLLNSSPNDKKRPLASRIKLTTTSPAKKQRQEVDQDLIDLFSASDEAEDDIGENVGDRGSDSDIYGLGVDTETETEEGEEEQYETNEDVADIYDDDDDDEDWVESENDDGCSEDEEQGVAQMRVVDTIGKLCSPGNRSPHQTKVVRERLRNSMYVLDALMCKPLPGKMCSRNCQQFRKHWSHSGGGYRSEMYQHWHEADAHIKCCKSKTTCEYLIRIKLREILHQIEHQHDRINCVRGELKERMKEYVKANDSRSTYPPSKITLLNEQIGLLERELENEEVQLIFYQCRKKEKIDAAKEAEIDTATDLADVQAHYFVKTPTGAGSAIGQATVNEAIAAQVVPITKSVTTTDDLLPSRDDIIGKLCYAGQRSQQQTEMFKECLRKSIEFVDALLCKPPQGKVCIRDCKKISANRCAEDVPCDFEMCRNWHIAEAHTDNCQNPQCEFKLRIILRETMHSIEQKKLVVQEERAKVWKKRSALKIIKDDEENAKHQRCNYLLVDSRNHDRFLESEILQDEIDQLMDDLAKEEQLLNNFNAKKKEINEKLYTIGIDENDDIIDGFPDFTTHYETKRGSKKQKPRHR